MKKTTKTKKSNKPTRTEYVNLARDLYQTDDVEIDDNAKLSLTGEGRSGWVAAWVWIADDDFNN